MERATGGQVESTCWVWVYGKGKVITIIADDLLETCMLQHLMHFRVLTHSFDLRSNSMPWVLFILTLRIRKLKYGKVK